MATGTIKNPNTLVYDPGDNSLQTKLYYYLTDTWIPPKVGREFMFAVPEEGGWVVGKFWNVGADQFTGIMIDLYSARTRRVTRNSTQGLVIVTVNN